MGLTHEHIPIECIICKFIVFSSFPPGGKQNKFARNGICVAWFQFVSLLSQSASRTQIDVMDLRKLKWFICVEFLRFSSSVELCKHVAIFVLVCTLQFVNTRRHGCWWYFCTLIINCDRFEIIAPWEWMSQGCKLYLVRCPRKFSMRMMKDANFASVSIHCLCAHWAIAYTHFIGDDVDSMAIEAK